MACTTDTFFDMLRNTDDCEYWHDFDDIMWFDSDHAEIADENDSIITNRQCYTNNCNNDNGIFNDKKEVIDRTENGKCVFVDGNLGRRDSFFDTAYFDESICNDCLKTDSFSNATRINDDNAICQEVLNFNSCCNFTCEQFSPPNENLENFWESMENFSDDAEQNEMGDPSESDTLDSNGSDDFAYQSTQRRVANERERNRMRTINEAFKILKNKIPIKTNKSQSVNKSLSKVDTLKCAIRYIRYLTGFLVTEDGDGKPFYSTLPENIRESLKAEESISNATITRRTKGQTQTKFYTVSCEFGEKSLKREGGRERNNNNHNDIINNNNGINNNNSLNNKNNNNINDNKNNGTPKTMAEIADSFDADDIHFMRFSISKTKVKAIGKLWTPPPILNTTIQWE